MTQAEVRKQFVYHNPGIRRLGKKGFWYRCAHCGKWCGRPGGEHAKISDDQKMEVDHIRPWSQGGSDALWNLQPLCKPCNRKKSNNPNLRDGLKMVGNNIIHADGLTSGVRKSVRNNAVLKGLGITKRR